MAEQRPATMEKADPAPGQGATDARKPALLRMREAVTQRIPKPAKLAAARLLSSAPGPVGLHSRRHIRYVLQADAEPDLDHHLAANAGRIGFDLGANLGAYTTRMARHCSKVYAFEPDPWTLERLRRACDPLDNVEIVAAAAGAEAGTLPLYRSVAHKDQPEAASVSSNILGPASGTEDSGLRVPVVDFVAFLDGVDGPLGVLKMDIEGAETELLERMLDTGALFRFRAVFVETHEWKHPGHMARIDRLWQRTRPGALAARAAPGTDVPYVNLEWL